MIYYVDDNNIKELDASWVEHIFLDYVPNNSIIVFSSQSISIDFLKNLNKDVFHIVFDDCTNPSHLNQILDQTTELIDYTVLTGDLRYYANPHLNSHVKFFPFWQHWVAKQNYSLSKETRSHKLSSLNGTAWNHRKLIYLELSKRPWFADMIFTFGNRPPCYDWQNTLTTQEQTEFDQLPNTVKFVNEDSNLEIDLSIDHPAFRNSWVNLVVETTVNPQVGLLSEKTFKPIASGQLFVLLGSPGSVEYLRDAGFDLFDDLIDHSYDTVLDLRQRIKMIVDQLDHLVQLDLDSIGPTLFDRFRANKDILVKLTLA